MAACFPKRPPPVVVLWVFRWLIFRLMLGAALIKLHGDFCWHDLTALYYHFELQPASQSTEPLVLLPAPLDVEIRVLFNYLAELIAPWFALYPRIARHIAGGDHGVVSIHAHPRRQPFIPELADHCAGARLFR